jgi:hypothetical protein
MNRQRTIVRVIHCERGFYVMYEKRPINGKFRKPIFDSQSGAKNGAYPPTQNGHIRSLLSGRCHDSSFTLQI